MLVGVCAPVSVIGWKMIQSACPKLKIKMTLIFVIMSPNSARSQQLSSGSIILFKGCSRHGIFIMILTSRLQKNLHVNTHWPQCFYSLQLGYCGQWNKNNMAIILGQTIQILLQSLYCVFQITSQKHNIFLLHQNRSHMSKISLQSPSVLGKGFSRNKDILSKLKLLGKTFEPIVPQHITRYIEKMEGDLESIELALSIMHDYKKKPEQMLKNLCFIHFVMQVHHQSFTNDMFQLVREQIGDLSEAAQQYLEAKREANKKEAESASSPRKLFASLFGKQRSMSNFSDFSQARSKSFDLESLQDLPDENNDTASKNGEKRSEVLESKEEIICSKIILPYCGFLLKLSATLNNTSLEKVGQSDFMYLWGMINTYKSMTTVTKCFPYVLRYYQAYFHKMIMVLTQVFDAEVRLSYQAISDSIEFKLNKVKKEFDVMMLKSTQNEEEKTKELEELREKYSLKDLKQIFLEVSKINDSIMMLYHNKYLVRAIDKIGMECPEFLQDVSDEVEAMFHILEEIENLEHKKMKKSKRKVQPLSNSLRMGRMKSNIGSFKNVPSPLLVRSEPLTAGMKPKFLKVKQVVQSDLSPLKEESHSIVFEDEKGENESCSGRDKVSEVSSTFQEIKAEIIGELQ